MEDPQQSTTGPNPDTERVHGRPSDHFNGRTFFQPGSHPERSLLDVLKWKLTSRPTRWPREVNVPVRPLPAPPANGAVLTWLGHASFLLQTPGGNVLFDPVFSERASPVTWAGPRRVHRVPIALDQLPRIDAVCVSHDHYDHLDAPTLRYLARDERTVFLAPLRHRALLETFGARKIVELDWWESFQPSDTVSVTLTPTKHWTRRLGTPRNHRLWGGFWVKCGVGNAECEFRNAEFGVRNADCGTEGGRPSAESLDRRHRAAPGGTETAECRTDAVTGGASADRSITAPACPTGNHSAIRNPNSAIIWFVGDSGYDGPLFHTLRQRLGTPDVALVPIGAYEPRWFMAPMHMNPAEAVQLHQDSGARVSVAMHWGTFQLTDEGRDEPVRALEAARAHAGVQPESFRVLEPGESLTVPVGK